MPWLIFAALAFAVVCDAWAQGGITLRNRQYIPPSEQRAINTDLHLLLATTFFLSAGAAVALAARQWEWIYVAGLLRLALFDPVLNTRKGDPLFATGGSAMTDRLLARVPAINPVLRVAALAAAVTVVALFLS